MLDESAPYIPKGIRPIEKVIPYKDCNYYTYTWKTTLTGERYRGRILVIHGYRDVHMVYYYTMEQLTKAGFDVFYFDQRGEGRTVLVNGEKGTASDETAFEAVDFFIAYNLKVLSQESKPDRLYLFTVSMGGGIALNYAAIGKLRTKITAIANIGPLILLHPKTYPGKWTELLVRALCTIPWLQGAHVKTDLHADYIAGDEKYVNYLADRNERNPLYATLVESRDFLLRGRKLLTSERYEKIDKKLPILICHGTADYINDIKGSREFMEKLESVEGMENKRLIEYPGGRHVLFICEPEIRDKSIQDVVDFFNEFQ
ncbi:hypothetical protein FOA43_004627 [Brettanomyces nanus]|uniref:Serine aminopeptidase S33 domain-containing protein n=1 Tax=Eeniella nana TaxID=13502 RepID=A0A875RQJ9_EENNA|nr:uncharacterized protein FOA43_004627 [Brettanomyces nanus]QPG77220.1 hypothetical protein FOA43_004627 [Brettanomyces nanus]